MTSLDDVAAAADAVAAEQRTVARTAREMQRARDRGVPWSTIIDRQHVAAVAGQLRRSANRLRDASTAFMSLLARGLAAEGESRRRIAGRLGVSHQRVTSILHGNNGADATRESAAE
jgi:hypothetical protein